MHCSISKENLKKYRALVANQLINMAKGSEPFSANEYMKKIYSLVMDRTSEQSLAIDYARITPSFIANVAANLSVEQRSSLRKLGLSMDELYLAEERYSDAQNGYDAVVSDLGINKSVQLEIQAIERGPVVQPSDGGVVTPLAKTLSSATLPMMQVPGAIAAQASANAAITTLLTDMPVELLNRREGKERVMTELLNPDRVFSTKVKHNIISALASVSYDSSELNYQGKTAGGVYLTAMSITRIESEGKLYADEDMLADRAREGVVAAITDKDGRFLYFDDNGNISNRQSGKIAYYPIRNPYGPVNKKKQGASQLSSIREHVRRDKSKNISINKIIGGSLGFIPTGAKTKLRSVNIKGGLSFIYSDLNEGKIEIALSSSYADRVYVELPSFASEMPDGVTTDDLISLLTNPSIKTAHGNLSLSRRISLLSGFLNLKSGPIGISPSGKGFNLSIYIDGDIKVFDLSTDEKYKQNKDVIENDLRRFFNNVNITSVKEESELTSAQKKAIVEEKTEGYNPGDVVFFKEEGGNKFYAIMNYNKIHINKDFIVKSGAKIELPYFSETSSGEKVLKTTKRDFIDYAKDTYFTSASVGEDGGIISVGSHFVFSPVSNTQYNIQEENSPLQQIVETEAEKIRADVEQSSDPSLTTEEKENAIKNRIQESDISQGPKVNYIQEGQSHQIADIERRRFEEIADYEASLGIAKSTGVEELSSIEQEVVDNINARYDAEYIEAVKKGEMTKEQAMQALEEVGRKNSKAYAELAVLQTTQNDVNLSHDSIKKAIDTSKFDDLLRAGKDALLLRGNVKSLNLKESSEKMESALTWFNSSPLSKTISLTELFSVINNSNPDAVATFFNSAITLYKGSDYTDLYHESWHAFSQMYMPVADKVALYESLNKKVGGFVDYAGDYVKFKDANYLQLEEYLAEEFKKYMISGGKMKIQNPEQRGFFQKILSFFRNLFGFDVSSVDDRDILSNKNVRDLFNRLSVGNFTGYSFDRSNAIFGILNQTLLSTDNYTGPTKRLSYQSASEAVKLIDSIQSEYVNLQNSGLSFSEYLEMTNIGKNYSSATDSQKERYEELSSARVTYKYTSGSVNNVNFLKSSYEFAKEYIDSVLIPELISKHASEKNPFIADDIANSIDLARWIVDNYGDIDSAINNRNEDAEAKKGVVAYHLLKTEKYLNIESLEDENRDENNTGRSEYSNKDGNEIPWTEQVTKEVRFAMSHVPKVDKQGAPVYNKFGVREIVPFTEILNRTYRLLSGTLSVEEMEAKIFNASESYPQFRELLRILGPSSNTSKMEANLWTGFFKSFNKPRVNLMQLTIKETENGVETSFGEAINSDSSVVRTWESRFKTATPGPDNYFLRDDKGNFLDTDKLMSDFDRGGLNGRAFDFYKAIGFALSDVPELSSLVENTGVSYFYDKISAMSAAGIPIRSISDIVNDTLGLFTTKTESKGLLSRFKKIISLEVNYSDIVNNTMVTNAAGQPESETRLNSSMTVMVEAINKSNSFQELISMPHMEYLDIEKYPFSGANRLLNSVFHMDRDSIGTENFGKRRFVGGDPVILEFKSLSGVANIDESGEAQDGVDSFNSDPLTKKILDLHTFAQYGTGEIFRLADRKSSYMIYPSYSNKDETGVSGPDNRNYISVKHFLTGDYQEKASEIFIPYIEAEMQRIRNFRKLKDSKSEDYEFDYSYLERGSDFFIFDKMLADNTKKSLNEIINNSEQDSIFGLLTDPSNIDLLISVNRDIESFFSNLLDYTIQELDSVNIFSKTIMDMYKPYASSAGASVDPLDISMGLLNAYTYNSYINNLESVVLFMGDPAQYKISNDSLSKRSSQFGSTGNLLRTDEAMSRLLYDRGSLYAESKNYPRRNYQGKFNTSIVKDSIVSSQYLNEIKAAIGEGKSKKYEEINEADAQGVITMDSYRAIKISMGEWLDDHESLYLDIINGVANPVSTGAIFTPLKMQYAGPISGLDYTVFANHKMSLYPLIPGVGGRNASELHDKMMRQQVDYVIFESASKVGTVTKASGVDRLYSEEREIDKSDFTINSIYLNYFKNQVEIAPEFKGNIVFPIQVRTLIESDIYENGSPVSADLGKLADRYESLLTKLTEIKKEQLAKEIGGVYEDGEVGSVDVSKLLNLVKRELGRREIGDHSLDFIKVNKYGSVSNDLSLSLNADQIDRILNALVVKRISRMKVKGEGLYQVASTIFESDSSVSDRRSQSEALANKWGSNDLPFYRKGKDGKTLPMKVKIALQGDFVKLLELKHPDGSKIGSLGRLNSLLKNEDWMKDNGHFVRMVGVRIPTQGFNSMEFMEVYEFLPSYAGPGIILPTEITAKAGSDFDIDKLTILMPYISSGSFKINIKEGERKRLQSEHPDLDLSRNNIDILVDMYTKDGNIDLFSSDDKSVFELIRPFTSQKISRPEESGEKGVYNSLIDSMYDILSHEDVYASLMTPNDTDILYIEGDSESLANRMNEIFKKKNRPDRSGSALFSSLYNWDKHDYNAVGKQVLSIGASDNLMASLYKRTGFLLNPYSGISPKEYNSLIQKRTEGGQLTDVEIDSIRAFRDYSLVLPYNAMDVNGYMAIALGGIYDSKNKNKISDVSSQLMNGWLDVAKYSWIFDIHGNKEIGPKLLFLVSAGVPVDTSVLFLSNPLIQKYVNRLNQYTSPVSQITSGQPRFGGRLRAKKELISLVLGRSVEDYSTSEIEIIVEREFNRLKNKLTKDGVLSDSELLKSINPDYMGSDYKMTDLDKLALFQYIKIEDIVGSLSGVKSLMRFDKLNDNSTFSSVKTRKGIESIRNGENNIVSEYAVENILNNTPVSSFNIAEGYQSSLFKSIMQLHSNEKLQNFAFDKFANNSRLISKIFGRISDGGDARYFNTFMSDLMGYLVQNQVKSFNFSDSNYKGYGLIKSQNSNVAVSVKNGNIYLNENLINSEFNSELFLKVEYLENGYMRIPAGVFASSEDYAHFLTERELFRSVNDNAEFRKGKEFLSAVDVVKSTKYFNKKTDESDADYSQRVDKWAFEIVARNNGLINSFNFNSLFYGRNSFADAYLSIKDSYPSLSERYSVFSNLFYSSSGDIGNDYSGKKNIKLSSSRLESDMINLLHEELLELSDRSVKKVDNEIDNERISSFFTKLPIVSVFQSGFSTFGELSLMKIVPTKNIYTGLMNGVSDLKKDLNSQDMPMINDFYSKFISNNRMANKNRGKDYYSIGYNQPAAPLTGVAIETEDGNMIQSYSVPSTNVFSSVLSVDFFIENLLLKKEDGYQLVFSPAGYAQDFISTNLDTENAENRELFVYLSQRLYEEFGYVNPGFILTEEGFEVQEENSEFKEVDLSGVPNSGFIKGVSDVEFDDFSDEDLTCLT